MAEFQFKSGVKTLDVKDPNGNLIKTFSINVGNKEATKKWMKELKAVEIAVSEMTKDETMLDQLEIMEKSIIDSVLGAGSFDLIYPICENNVMIMLSFVKYLSDFLNESLQEIYKGYV
jgi:phosphomevalonate kinase